MMDHSTSLTHKSMLYWLNLRPYERCPIDELNSDELNEALEIIYENNIDVWYDERKAIELQLARIEEQNSSSIQKPKGETE